MTIRYDFWSLVTALADGLEHGKKPADERAKAIADALSKQSQTERSKRAQRLSVVPEYLGAIQHELTAPDGKTVEWKK